MGFEPCGLVGNQGVGGGVGFVETVAGEFFHVVEDFVGFSREMPCFAAPSAKISRCFTISSGFFLPMARRSKSAPPSE